MAIVQDGRGVYFNQASLRMMGAAITGAVVGTTLARVFTP